MGTKAHTTTMTRTLKFALRYDPDTNNNVGADIANPFKRADRDGAPSIRPTPPESAETPMPDPTETQDLPLEADRTVDRPAAPPSAETPMEPPPADKPPAES